MCTIDTYLYNVRPSAKALRKGVLSPLLAPHKAPLSLLRTLLVRRLRSAQQRHSSRRAIKVGDDSHRVAVDHTGVGIVVVA